jgi:hypothetical protein
MGGGDGNLVRIVAVHYFIENLAVDANADLLIQQGLSSNPEHNDVGAGAFDVFPQDKAIYAKSAIISNHDGVLDSTATRWADRVPCYGLVRPRRQIWVWSILNGEAATGIWIEVWYEPFEETNKVQRDRVNREFGKYRRS